MGCLRKRFAEEVISERASDLIISSRREGILSTYSPSWNNWASWCVEQNVDPVRCTISDWLKNILKSPGINVLLFTAHSTRSATTSKPSASDFLSMIKILERGTWSNKSTSKGSIRRILSQYVQKIFKTVLWEEHNDAVNRRRRPRLQ